MPFLKSLGGSRTSNFDRRKNKNKEKLAETRAALRGEDKKKTPERSENLRNSERFGFIPRRAQAGARFVSPTLRNAKAAGVADMLK